MVIIVLELTNSYAYALASLVGLAISVGYVQVRFGSSYFDVQLLNRGIDISDGRTGLFMYETEILEFAEVNFQTVKESDSVEKAISLMSSTNQSELIVLDANEELHTLPNYTAGTYGNDNGSVDISLDTQGAGTSFSYDIVPEFENIYILVKY